MSDIETVYEDEEFSVVKEVVQGVCFFHCYVESFSKSTLKRMREVWEDVKTVSKQEGWIAIHSYTRNPRFAMALPGAEKLSEFSAEGKHYEVIQWVLK